MTTGKTIALNRRTFVGKVMFLLLNMLSRLVIAFLQKRKCLLISWLQSPSAVILEPQKIKPDTVSTQTGEIILVTMTNKLSQNLLLSEDMGKKKLIYTLTVRSTIVYLKRKKKKRILSLEVTLCFPEKLAYFSLSQYLIAPYFYDR